MLAKNLTARENRLDAILPIVGPLAAFIVLMVILAF
jgi:hypothetical protein